MYLSHEIKVIHLEPTTRCNASCPMCTRNILGGQENPYLPKTELSLEDIKRGLPPGFIRRLQKVFMCGNYGDPAAAQESLEIMQYLRSLNPRMQIGIHTNGSLRSAQWWRGLAEVVDYCRFAIDGLEDTNHIYRRGTQWPKIIENMKSFIAAGKGVAEWDYIVFRHNEHQVEQARELARQLGVKSFRVKKTGRFLSSGESEVKTKQEVLKKDGTIDYYLEMPENPAYINPSLNAGQKLVQKFGSLDAYYDRVPVVCKVQQEKSIYISAEGHIFPCCWTGAHMYPWYSKGKWTQFRNLVEALPQGLDTINMLKNDLFEIIDGPFFQQTMPNAWKKSSMAEGKLKVCAKTCGVEMDLFQHQFENNQL